jgi:hypothetical protein
MRDGDLHALPVIQGETVLGVLSDLDLLAWVWEQAVDAAP